MTVAERTTLRQCNRETQNKREVRARTDLSVLESKRGLADCGLRAHEFGLGLSLVLIGAAVGCVAFRTGCQTDLPLGRLAGRGLHASHEALNLASGVHNALLTGVERVADIAQVRAQVLARRARREGVSARARDRRIFVLGV